ncbi:MAG TPA: hypothetical protein VES95_04465 [Dermatophilaceae bacterium]|nr:hypothetical protein [Dermatophilaceae bacterium]
MITGVAVVPAAPLLLPEYVGRHDPGAALRDRCTSAVHEAVAGAERVVVVTGTDRPTHTTRPPLGERVARLLLADGPPDDVVLVPTDADPEVCRAAGERLAAGSTPTALVVAADGSARRGEKAPGHLDERAFAVDEAVTAALAAPDLRRLLDLDPALCADVLFGGRAALQVLGGALATGAGGPAYRTVSLHTEDPFGVRYVVAVLRVLGPHGQEQ